MDERASAILALYRVAIRSRFSPASGPLRRAVGGGWLRFLFFSLNWFKEHKSSEKIIALQLVDAFVTNYSAIRSQFGKDAPVPASIPGPRDRGFQQAERR